MTLSDLRLLRRPSPRAGLMISDIAAMIDPASPVPRPEPSGPCPDGRAQGGPLHVDLSRLWGPLDVVPDAPRPDDAPPLTTRRP